MKDTPEPLRFSVAKDERPKTMEFHYTMGDDFNGHWKGEITPTPNGTRLNDYRQLFGKGLVRKDFDLHFLRPRLIRQRVE